jgi:hypothetical protein
MRNLFISAAILFLSLPAHAEEQKYEFDRNPATAKMMAMCDSYVLDEMENAGKPADDAKIQEVEARLEASKKFISENLGKSEQTGVDEAVKIFNSYYQRDMDMLKSKKRPYTADTVQKICVKHASGAGKKFDATWQEKLAAVERNKSKNKDGTAAVESKPAEPVQAAKLPSGTPAISDEARTKLMDSLNKTLATIDESLNNKFTSEEEKLKLSEQRKRIEAEVARWQKKS